jgi:hypothetical protein
VTNRVIVRQAHLPQAFLVRAIRFYGTDHAIAMGFGGLRCFREGEATYMGAQSGQHVATGPHGVCHLAVHLVPEERFRKGQAQPAYAIA